ncbi:MAG: metal ABC transporter permease [Clostridiales bacterium]|nr:metal ABC transporter permease [Clostridiales bacterium]
MSIIEELKYYLSFDFVKYALIVGGLISLCCAILGVTLVLKRYSMIGDGLSHVAFGAMTVAMVLAVVDMYVMLPITILVAILLIRLTDRGKVKNDSAIAMLSVGALAFGYIIVNLFSENANISGDVCSSLFGLASILTLSSFEVWFCVGVTIFLLIFFVVFHNKIFGVTFDKNFATATGVKSEVYNNIIAVIIGIVIVLAMKLVGSLLISALIVFPALSAIRLFKSYKKVIIFASIIGVINSIFGILVSILWGTPVGATIVIVDIFVYVICWLIDIITRNLKRA